MNQAILNIHLKLKRLVKTGKLNTLEKDIDKRQANLSQNNPKALETWDIIKDNLKDVGKTQGGK